MKYALPINASTITIKHLGRHSGGLQYPRFDRPGNIATGDREGEASRSRAQLGWGVCIRGVLSEGRSTSRAVCEYFGLSVLGRTGLQDCGARGPQAGKGQAMFFAWVFARSTKRMRLREHRLPIPPAGVFTKFVVEELSRLPRDIPTDIAALSPTELSDTFERVVTSVIGVVLLRPRGHHCVSQILSAPDRACRDFWLLSKHGCDTLFFVDVLCAARLCSNIGVNSTRAGQVPKGMFFELSRTSFQTVASEHVEGQDISALQLVRRWEQQFGCQLLGVAGNGLAVAMPAPHALLVVHGLWASFAFPLPPTFSRHGMGVNLVESWIQGHDLPAAVCQRGGSGSLDAMGCSHIGGSP